MIKSQHDLSAMSIATELVGAINSDDMRSLTSFTDRHFFAEALDSNEATQDFVRWVLWFRQLTRGISLLDTASSVEAKSLVLQVEDRAYSGRHAITIRFSDETSRKIRTVNGMPVSRRHASATKQSTGHLMDQVEKLCDRGRDAGVFSGAALLAAREEILFEYACGEANKRYGVPNNIDTKFNIGSANKMFTAVALAQLWELNHVRFDAPISLYLGDDWIPKADAERITIAHLLTHRSGLGDYFGLEFEGSSRGQFRALRHYKSLVHGQRLAFAPGSQFAYSNMGFLLAGAIVERVSGMSYFEYVHQRIHLSCAMQDTACYDMDDPVQNLAMGYVPTRSYPSGWRENIFDHVAKGGPAGGGFSTVRDLHRFGVALLSDRLISRETRDLLWTDGNGEGYGYGFAVDLHDGVYQVGHAGGFPGVSANFQIRPREGLISVVLSNIDSGALELSRHIRDLI